MCVVGRVYRTLSLPLVSYTAGEFATLNYVCVTVWELQFSCLFVCATFGCNASPPLDDDLHGKSIVTASVLRDLARVTLGSYRRVG